MQSPLTRLSRLTRDNAFHQRCGKSRMLLQPLLLVSLLAALPLPAAADAPLAEVADAAAAASLVTPEWAERYLYSRNSALLDDSFNDHVMSFYYFGRVAQRTLIGLERVRGDDYEQFFSLLVFEDTHLLGYYRNVLSFPSGVSDSGDVQFPRGVNAHLQGSDALLNIALPAFSALCQRQRGSQTQALAELCVPWTAVHSQ